MDTNRGSLSFVPLAWTLGSVEHLRLLSVFFVEICAGFGTWYSLIGDVMHVVGVSNVTLRFSRCVATGVSNASCFSPVS